MREHYQAMERRGNKRPELIQPEVPKQARYLLGWFCELSVRGEAVSWMEMKAWAELTDKTLSYWEIQTLRAIEKGYWND